MAYGPKNQILDTAEAAAAGRDTNAIMQGWIDRGPWQYWDTINFTAGAQASTSYSPFSLPIGQVDPVTNTAKTKLQTNLQRGNQFPPPKCLLLMAIGFYFQPGWALSDVEAFLNSTYMQFKIDDKIFHEGFLWMFPPGGAITGFSQVPGESVFTLGLPAPQYQRRMADWSKYIAPLQQFSMELIVGGGGVAVPTIGVEGGPTQSIIVTMDGLTDRSVQ